MGELTAFGTGRAFRYDGSISQGTLIFYDESGYVYMPPRTWRELLSEFAGRTVELGGGEPPDARPEGSLGAWLARNVTPRDLAALVAAILVAEGKAEPKGENSVRFGKGN